MTEYSVEEVRNAARLLDGLSRRMLNDYAGLLERIKADARPVAQGEAVAGARIRRIDGAVVYDLALTPAGELLPDGLHQFYTTPPAQPRAVPAERVVDGWVLVPREPTPEMLAAVAGMEISVRVAEDDTAEYPVPEDDCAEIYRAMLAAGTSPGESNSKPTDCSGDPSSCPDNEGRGCYCSDLRRVGESA